MASQFTPLMMTKVYRPRSTAGVVARPRLQTQLRSAMNGALTLVAAPAGYGKTTLVAEQLTTLPHPGAWLTLDPDDNDPATFARYLVWTVQSVAPLSPATRSLAQATTPLLQAVLVSLANDLAALSDPIILVLDDYHVITNPVIHTTMNALLDPSPPALRVVILTREDPPLPLARLRARRQLTEIRAVDLRFTPSETAAFLHENAGVILRPDDLEVLEQRTEGWIVGLQLAALSMERGHSKDIPAFVKAFSGSNGFVLDYLLDEVLGQLPGHLHTFLLSTSILEHFCGPLCDAVMGLESPKGSGDHAYSQEILADLERRQLFLVSLDTERRWFRYHPLFADVLRQRLHIGASRHEVHVLHQRASTWLEVHSLLPGAVPHAIEADDWDRAIRLIEQHGLLMMLRGHVHTVLDWLREVPEPLQPAHPFLEVIHGAGLMFTQQLPEAEARLQAVEQRVATGMVDEAYSIVRGTALLLRANLTRFRGDLPQFLLLAQEALGNLPERATLQRSVAQLNLASSYVITGDVTASVEHTFRAALESVWKSGDLSAIIRGEVALAGLERLQGRLRQAEATYRSAAALIADVQLGTTLVDGAAFAVGLGDVLREQNDLGEAERYLLEGQHLMRGSVVVSADVITDGTIALARVKAAQGTADDASLLLNELLHHAQANTFADAMIVRTRAALAHLALLRGDQDSARNWITTCGLHVDDNVAFLHEYAYLTLARVFVAQGRQDQGGPWIVDVIRLLDRWQTTAVVGNRKGSLVEILVLRALALAAQYRAAEALTVLAQVLELAGPQGYLRVFLDEGAPMYALLRSMKTEGVGAPSLDHVLRAFERDKQSSALPIPTPVPCTDNGLRGGEELTAREREVLRLIAEGASNQAIADRLIISLQTVKKHVNNIMGKLDARNRTEAVARARSLGMI